jgi:hypothetical protein
MTDNLSGEMVRGGTVCMVKAGLGIGSTPAQLSIAAPNGAGVDYCINGYAYHLADDASVAMSAMAVQADLTSCLYLVLLDSSGTLTTVKGEEELTADVTSNKNVLAWPQPTEDTCPIGAFRVDNDGGTFTGGTTSLAAGTVTDTYYDFFAIPDSPITS